MESLVVDRILSKGVVCLQAKGIKRRKEAVNPHKFIRNALVAAVGLCLAAESFAAKTQKSLAKIIGEYPAQSSLLGVSWYYNWGGFSGTSVLTNMEFVPMIWGAKKLSRHSIDSDQLRLMIRRVLAANPDCKNLLTFNEPDGDKQSNLSVQEVLNVWPVFEQEVEGKGIRLGSPGVAGINSEWLDEFMAGVKRRKYRVDFLCVHRRVSFQNNPVDTVLRECRNLYQKYKKPIWITELELVGNGMTEADVIRIYRQWAERLENDSSVEGIIERYAIAYAPPDTTNANKIVARPYAPDGTMTDFGRAFQILHEPVEK